MSVIEDRGALVEWLVAEARRVGVSEADGAGLERALDWLAACWGAGESHLPLAIVHDLGHLLLRGHAVRFASSRDLSAWDPAEQALRLDYEDNVLGRWLRDPTVDAAHLALAGVQAADRDAAVTHAITLALAERLRPAELVEGNPAMLRTTRRQVLERGALDEPTDPDWHAFISEQRARAVAQVSDERLFQPADLWEIAHFSALPSASLRLALRQLHKIRDAVPAPDGGLLAQVQRRAREVPVDDQTAAEFPAGGFDGISQKGRFENLVRSEIGYVDTEVLPGVADAFDIRFVLGELLFYTRDESPLLDAHRAVTVCFDQPAHLRVKLARLPVQILVLAQGLALALYRDLCQMFGRRAVSVHLRWRCHDGADQAVAQEEAGLLSTSLAEDIAHGRVSVEIIEPGPLDGHVIMLSPRAAPGRQGRRTTWLRIDAPVWQVTGPRGGQIAHDMGAPDGLRATVDSLLHAAVGLLA